METVTLEAAEQSGFLPRTYPQYRQLGKLRVKADFIANMGGGQTALFFHEQSRGERGYAVFNLHNRSGVTEDGMAVTLTPYLQRGDIYDISIDHANYVLGIREIILIEQQPLCAWREQCDQLSPCCVFKS